MSSHAVGSPLAARCSSSVVCSGVVVSSVGAGDALDADRCGGQGASCDGGCWLCCSCSGSSLGPTACTGWGRPGGTVGCLAAPGLGLVSGEGGCLGEGISTSGVAHGGAGRGGVAQCADMTPLPRYTATLTIHRI